jgi:hypothetical protein
MNNKLKTILQDKISDKKNKSIEDITKKIQKIEKLTTDFEILKEKIKALKLQVDEQSKEEKSIFCKTKEKYLLLIIEKYFAKGLAKWQKDLIAEMINEEYELILDFDYESEAISEAISRFLKYQSNEMSSIEKQMTREALADMMAEFGLDDDDEFDFTKMHDPKFKKEFQEKMKEKFQQEQEKQKEFEKQKQVAKTDIDFQKVYKKLAKLTHPDLYKTEGEKATKEVQMQRLTKAWNERNYYDLLMVWLEVDPENTIELEITESNQKNIIKQLNEQINKIEADIYNVKFQYPDTSFYYQNFNAANPKTVTKKINEYVKTLVLNIEETNFNYKLFQKTVNLKRHLEKVYDSRDANDFDDFFNFFNSKSQ